MNTINSKSFSMGLLLTLSAATACASELVYEPINPNFGGNPLNASALLANANAQNDLTDPDAPDRSSTGTSALDRFTSSLESRLLSQLLTDIGQGNSGSLTTDAFTVDIIDDGGVLTIVITDNETGESTEIVVSGLDPNN